MAKMIIEANRSYKEPEPVDEASNVDELRKKNAELNSQAGFFGGMLLTAGIAIIMLIFALIAAASKG